MQIVGNILMIVFAGWIIYTVIVFGLSHPETGWGKLVTEYYPLPVPDWIQDKIADRKAAGRAHLDAVLDAVPTGESRVRAAKEGAVLTINGARSVGKGAGKLLELKFFNGNKANKVHIGPDGPLREFTIVTMTSGDLLTEQPEGEGKSRKFFKYKDVSDKLPRAFAAYCKGTPAAPGPVARFAASEQSSEEFFDNVAGERWQLTDIVWADLQVESGKVFAAPGGPMPRFVMILAQSIKDPEKWLLYMEPRSGGLDPSLWIGGQFDPEVEVRAYA